MRKMANPDRKSKEERESENNEPKKGTLYVVSTPIGNDEDISLRALRVLKNSDIVVCEEGKIGARLLHKLNLHQRMELLNEQNEEEKTPELLKMLEGGMKLSLVSDAGTPLFADPGDLLVKTAIKKGIYVSVVPGASSIMAALVRSTFNLQKFYYGGFLSRKPEERYIELKKLSNFSSTIVLLETPYRIMPVLSAAAEIMPDRRAYIGCNLTMKFETHHYGTFKELLAKFSDMKFKGEFVICIEGSSLAGDDDYKNILSNKREDYRRGGDRRDDRRFNRSDSGGRDFRRDRGGYSRDKRRSSDDGGGYSRDKRRSSDGGGGYSRDKRRSSDGGGGYSRDKRRSSDGGGGYSRDKRRSSDSGGGYSRDKRRSSDGGGGYSKDKRKGSFKGGRSKSNNFSKRKPRDNRD